MLRTFSAFLIFSAFLVSSCRHMCYDSSDGVYKHCKSQPKPLFNNTTNNNTPPPLKDRNDDADTSSAQDDNNKSRSHNHQAGRNNSYIIAPRQTPARRRPLPSIHKITKIKTRLSRAVIASVQRAISSELLIQKARLKELITDYKKHASSLSLKHANRFIFQSFQQDCGVSPAAFAIGPEGSLLKQYTRTPFLLLFPISYSNCSLSKRAHTVKTLFNASKNSILTNSTYKQFATDYRTNLQSRDLSQYYYSFLYKRFYPSYKDLLESLQKEISRTVEEILFLQKLFASYKSTPPLSVNFLARAHSFSFVTSTGDRPECYNTQGTPSNVVLTKPSTVATSYATQCRAFYRPLFTVANSAKSQYDIHKTQTKPTYCQAANCKVAVFDNAYADGCNFPEYRLLTTALCVVQKICSQSTPDKIFGSTFLGLARDMVSVFKFYVRIQRVRAGFYESWINSAHNSYLFYKKIARLIQPQKKTNPYSSSD